MDCWDVDPSKSPRTKMSEEELEQFMEQAKKVGLFVPPEHAQVTILDEDYTVIDYLRLMG